MGAWVAQSGGRPSSAQVMISQVRKFKPCVGLCANSSEPRACFGFCVCVSLSAPPPLMLHLSLSVKNK